MTTSYQSSFAYILYLGLFLAGQKKRGITVETCVTSISVVPLLILKTHSEYSKEKFTQVIRFAFFVPSSVCGHWEAVLHMYSDIIKDCVHTEKDCVHSETSQVGSKIQT